MKISAVIITFNEEENIGDCIDSLTEIADEIIVVDSFSTDGTEKICREKNVKFIQHKFEGYSAQKNFGGEQSNFPWILSLDADERLSDELKSAIKEIKNIPEENVAFSISRLNNYCGKWIKHGVWYPDLKVRLWNKNSGSWNGMIHEKIFLNESVSIKKLSGNILHYTVRTPEQYKLQMEKFSDIAARSMKQEGKKSSLLKAYSSGVFAFVRSYILRLGFLDGGEGYEIAKGYSEYTRMKYLKMLK
ncbi:MAG: glycosyltransferase family 2 protein [Bacteroidota bacterium]